MDMDTDKKLTSEEELNNLCEEWQRLLRLQHWDVIVKKYRQYDMPDNVIGRCEWTYSKREALIKILDERDYDPSCIFPQDIEQTIVHELLHIMFAPFDAENGTPEQIAQEQVIDRLAKTLVSLKRKCLNK